jgi:PAS domain S-box-containing protein
VAGEQVGDTGAPGGVPQRRVDDIVAQVQDYAIIGLDPQGVIESWNLGAERVKGYTAEEAIGRSFAMFYTDEDRRSGLPLSLLLQARDEGRIEHFGWRVRKDGSRFWGDVIITATHDAEGNHVGFTKVTRDLTEQHDLELRLRASEERFRLLVGQVQDYAIIALDPQGTIETWNLGAERVKGYTAEEAIGRSFAMFYTEKDRRAGLPLRLLAKARDTGRVEHTGWRIRKDGTTFWGDVVITAIHDEDGHITGFAKVTRDRTDLKALEDAQDAFYAAFTHDFRTPVAALMGYVDAVRDATDEERPDLIERVETNAQRLLDMVGGLVEFATQRASHSALLMDDLDAVEVVRDAVHDLSPVLEPSRVQVTGDVAMAKANGVGLHRVITNLVVNALKYSPPGSPVEVYFAHEGEGRVQIMVADHGRGIDPADLVTIFDEFNRGRLAEPDGGTGLGLASVRELVKQMRGTVDIKSDVGVGTTVTLDLPAGSASTRPEPRAPIIHGV